MRKNISLFIMLFFLLSTQLLLTACDNGQGSDTNSCTHDWLWDSATVTCSEDGYVIYKCSKCSKTMKEYESAYGCYDYDEDGYCDDCYLYIDTNSNESENNTCNHTYLNATCTQPKKCSKCGETSGNALGHSYLSATCTKPETCSRCSHTSGTALGHSYLDATCTKPKTCAICGNTSGSTANHSYYWGKCSVCNGKDSNYFLTYSFGDTFYYNSESVKVRITISNDYTVVNHIVG